MKNTNVELHKVYAAKVSGNVVPVRLDSTNPHGGWNCTNMVTRKQCRVATAGRLRGLWPQKTMPIADAKPAADVGPTATPPPAAKTKANRDAEREKKNAADESRVAASQSLASSEAALARNVAAATADKPPRPSLLNFAADYLAKSAEPLGCQAMVAHALSQGWQTTGKTPAATLSSAILTEIKKKGADSRFVKSGRGLFKHA